MLNLSSKTSIMKNLIIASTSTVHGSGYLEYLMNELDMFYSGIDTIHFVPYARPGGISHDEYTAHAQKAFSKIGKEVIGIHSCEDPSEGILKAKGLFTGGGNTFVLVKQLHELGLMEVLREAIHQGTPYLGTSAGSNICGVSMQTTNDMPIVYPASFKTLGVIPFNINPHYLDPDPNSTHMGETRETRIQEFHTQNNLGVVGLREGSWLRVHGEEIQLKGPLSARIFEKGKAPYEISTNSLIDFL